MKITVFCEILGEENNGTTIASMNLINYLIKGPQNNNLQKLIPDGTRLNEIKIEKNCAIINFSNEILNYKDENEKLKIINSIVNTLTNLKEINSIKILVNGSENENFSDEYLRTK